MIITQAPMRITLAGGGTDVLWYSKLRGGAWISGAIDKYVFTFLKETEDQSLIKICDGTEITNTNDYKNISNPIIREALKLTKITQGIELSTMTDASAKSGLGGSGTFEVSLLQALHAYKREPVSQMHLAKEACVIEIDRLKKPVGPQDQYISALGGINYFEIDTKGRISVEPLNLSIDTLAELESNLLFFRTGIQREAASVLADEKTKVESKGDTKEATIRALNDIKTLGLKVKKYLLQGRVDEFGSSLHQHWLIKKRLSDKVSNPQIDEWYNAAMKAGALGGKIMGAGGGGWFVFYVNKNKNKFRERMNKMGLEERKVRFDWEGAKVLANLN